MNREKNNTVYSITLVGLMAAMCFVATFLRIDIPTPMGKTMLHLGNVMCLLSGLVLGPVKGGLAAGLGSGFFDLFDPAYIAGAPFTFAFKFCMAFVCGAISHKKLDSRPRRIAGAVLGSLSYVVLYVGKNVAEGLWFYRQPFKTVLTVAATKLSVSLTNGLIAVVVSLLLFGVMRPILKKAGVFDRLQARKER